MRRRVAGRQLSPDTPSQRLLEHVVLCTRTAAVRVPADTRVRHGFLAGSVPRFGWLRVAAFGRQTSANDGVWLHLEGKRVLMTGFHPV